MKQITDFFGKKNDIRRFASYLGKDKKSNLDLYFFNFSESKIIHSEPIANEIMRICVSIEDSVWNRKNSPKANFIDPGMLVLLYDHEIPVGLFTGWNRFHPEGNLTELYPCDYMILREYQGNDLASLGHLTLNYLILNDKAISVAPVFNLVCSGNYALFKYFERNSFFQKLNIFDNSFISKRCREILKAEFPECELNSSAILESAWCRQSKQQVWPKEILKKWNFPEHVFYGNGDIFCQIYFLNYEFHSKVLMEFKERVFFE